MTVDHPGLELSLRTSATIAELADQLRLRTKIGYSEAFAQIVGERPDLAAGLEGDTARHAELTGQARSTRFASPAGGAHMRRFRRGSPPRTLARRPIADRSELRPGETLCMHMHATPGAPAMFAGLVA